MIKKFFNDIHDICMLANFIRREGLTVKLSDEDRSLLQNFRRRKPKAVKES